MSRNPPPPSDAYRIRAKVWNEQGVAASIARSQSKARESWWAQPMTREQFDARCQQEQARMTWSRGAMLVTGMRREMGDDA